MWLVTVPNITIAAGLSYKPKKGKRFCCPLLPLDGAPVATLRSGYNNIHRQNV
jgi:hypothetical protein